MTNRRYILVRSGQGFTLEQTSAPTPEPGPGEVLIRVRAVSVNKRDNMILRGEGYPVGDADRFTPLSDAAGEIVALGAGVPHLKVGDRVASTFFQNWTDGRISLPAVLSALGAGGRGVFADHVVLSANGVVPIPDAWSFEQAACLPCAGVTAWSSLMTHGRLQAGDWVLVQGTGGVALFAVQIAVAAGAKVVLLSSSDEKLARGRSLGAAETINYATTSDWAAPVREVTGGVDHVLELGGAGTLAQSSSCLGVGGHLALVGGLAGFGGALSAAGLIMGAQRATAVTVGSRAEHLALSGFFTAHALRPVIDQVFSADAAQAAYDRAAAGAFGKVVIRLS